MAYFQGCIHRWLTFWGISDVNLQRIWKLKIPKKIKVYLWQGYSLPTKEQVFLKEIERQTRESTNYSTMFIPLMINIFIQGGTDVIMGHVRSKRCEENRLDKQPK
jgi:hypothetical protein